MRSLLILFIILIITGPALAREALEPDALRQFIDGFMVAQLSADAIPGAAVSIVHNGRIVHCRGYGVTDLRQRTPVSGTRTLFRIASLSKPIVFTAVMQLVERGALELHRNVNDYLAGFSVPHPTGSPVTLAHLMTHTPGFEDTYFRQWGNDTTAIPSLQTYLAVNVPASVYRPGTVIGYSNYGASLAGRLIEIASKQPYETYLQRAIFEPLAMLNTTAEMPPPRRLRRQMATSYLDGRPVRFEIILDRPAGAISSTAQDMAHFMIAHLELGRFGSTRILNPETAEVQQTVQFSHHRLLDGYTYGFVHQLINGERVLSHTGALVAFRSTMFLLPDHGVGVFAVYSSRAGSDAGRALKGVFLDRYFPIDSRTSSQQPTLFRAAGKAKNLGGWYCSTRLSHRSAAKVTALLGKACPLKVYGDGSLRFLARRWRPIAPDVYEETKGDAHPRRLAFKRRTDGSPSFVFEGINAFRRLLWYEWPTVQWTIFSCCQLLFHSYWIVWLMSWLFERRQRRSPYARAKGRSTRLLVLFLSLLSIAIATAFAVLMASGVRDPTRLHYGLPCYARLASIGTYVVAVLTAVTICAAVRAWRKRRFTFWARVHMTLVVLGAIVYVVWLEHWNLLGITY